VIITRAEYQQLVGLLTLAKHYNDLLSDIHDAVREITKEQDDMGHSSDAVFSNYDADTLLRKLQIKVEKNA